ncbi:MAG: hypothetical protein QNL04_03460 [SAR324 cluster bacterium]|nr:hypothetical protein [SAR324 cluster bacterium]
MNGMRRGRRSKKTKSFNPNHQEIERALAEFQSRGGEVKKVGANSQNLSSFIERKEERAIDEFFNGGSVSDLRF